MFFSAPLRFDLKKDRIRWSVDIEEIAKLGKDYIDLPESLSGVNDMGIESSKGIRTEWIDSNSIAVKFWHVNGTFILDRCTLELPITTHSIKPLIETIMLFSF